MSKSKVFEIIKAEEKRQNKNVELIASENFVSKDVLTALGSCFTNKYAEGYPDRNESQTGNSGRYYGGCENANILEQYCCDKWREVFKTTYHVNVQPHSGTQANMEAYAAVLKPGDTILSLDLNSGGHLSHGSKVSQSGKLYKIVSYNLTKDGLIDYKDLESKISEHHPDLILAGASAYPRTIDFRRIYESIRSVVYDSHLEYVVDKESSEDLKDYNPIFMVDMAHIAGLVATGLHPSPFGYADIITTTTHKTLRGPRGGLIFCKPELAKKIDSSVFPGSQGGPILNIIAAKAIAAEEACDPSFKSYMCNVVKSCRAMAEEFVKLGYDVATGGTDNHLFILDFSNIYPDLTGKDVQDTLDEHGITLNKNCVPNEKKSPKLTSGVRIGTAPMCSKGWTDKDFVKCAREIDKIIKSELIK